MSGRRKGHTLWLHKLSLLNTALQGTVELGVKGVLVGDGNGVVGLNIFLDFLAAINQRQLACLRFLTLSLAMGGRDDDRA